MITTTPIQVFDTIREETNTRGGALSIEAIDAARATMEKLAQEAEAALALTAKSSVKVRTETGERLRAAIDEYRGRAASPANADGSDRVVD